MKESEDRRAEIGEEDCEVFPLFVEWAYTRTYHVASKPVVEGGKDRIVKSPDVLTHWPCPDCKNATAALINKANTPACRAFRALSPRSECPDCSRVRRQRDTLSVLTELAVLCPTCQDQSHRVAEAPSGDTFSRSQQLGTHISCQSEPVSDALLASTPVSNHLLAHAKVYVFAEKYMIQPLVSLPIPKPIARR